MSERAVYIELFGGPLDGKLFTVPAAIHLPHELRLAPDGSSIPKTAAAWELALGVIEDPEPTEVVYRRRRKFALLRNPYDYVREER